MMELVYLQYLASSWPTPSWLSKTKSYPLTTHTFFPLMLVRHVTETDNLHSRVTQHKYTSNTTHKQSKQTENNQNCETLGLFNLLSAEIWITVMKNDRKCQQFFIKKNRKKMLVFLKNAEKNASIIEKGLCLVCFNLKELVMLSD